MPAFPEATPWGIGNAGKSTASELFAMDSDCCRQ
jgi:hypothetical protein